MVAVKRLIDDLIGVLWSIDTTARCYRDYEMNDVILLHEKNIHKNKIKAINERYLSK